MTLNPAFDSEVTEYTTTTSNATNTITATATDSEATVAITVNGDAVESGSAATWSAGENTVVVTVTNGTSSETYTVVVTKE